MNEVLWDHKMKVLPQIKSNVEYKRPCVETKTRTQLTHRKAYHMAKKIVNFKSFWRQLKEAVFETTLFCHNHVGWRTDDKLPKAVKRKLTRSPGCLAALRCHEHKVEVQNLKIVSSHYVESCHHCVADPRWQRWQLCHHEASHLLSLV